MPRELTALGVDVSEVKGLDLVLLDVRRQIVDRRRKQPVEGLGAYLAEHRPDLVAIDSPPAFGSSGGSRVAERELMRRGVQIYGTPSDGTDRPFYRWMHVGHAAFRAAALAGYPLYRGGAELAGKAVEVFPHACAVALDGFLPTKGYKKSVWRAQLLARRGVDAGSLRSPDQIDAALAALTGLLALEGTFCTVGDADGGVIVLPCVELPERYSTSDRAGVQGLEQVLERAIALAVRVHAGQRDKANQPYIRHPLRVMERVSGEGLEAMIAAVLHDVVEDGGISFDHLRREGIPETVIAALKLVTKLPEEKGSDEGYDTFVRRIAASGSRLAITVKLADLTDNSDLSRLGATVTDKDHARVAKYERARRVLTDHMK